MGKWKDVLFIIVSCILLILALSMVKHYIPSVKVNGLKLQSIEETVKNPEDYGEVKGEGAG